MSNPTKIVLNRQSDLILDNALITNPQGIVLTDISGVSEAVASINTSTSTDISVETSSRVAADASLQNQIDFITNNSDPSAIDSLTEVVAAFQSADGDLNGAITNLANAATVDLSAEISIRTSADESLYDRINQGDSGLDNRITEEISTEVSTRLSADESLYNRINQGDNGLDNRITEVMSTEISTRESADESLYNRINQGDSGLDNRITEEMSTEVSTRLSADESLYNRINQGDNGLDNRITEVMSTEISTRESADESLYNRINQGDSGLDNRITEEMSTEISTRESADESLYNRINQVGGSLDSRITEEISTEVSRAESAELSIVESLGSNLSSELSAEISNRLLGDDYLQSQIDDLAQTDGLTLDVDTTNNTIKLKDTVAAPITGIRTFEGLINVGSQPSNDGAFGDLSLVTKKFVEDADASIMSIVNNVITNIDPAAIDSLTEVVAAFQSADGDLNGTIINLTNIATTSLESEISARISSVESIDDVIDAFPLTDGQTIDVNIVDNTIQLKETVSAPDSGVRTFLGEVDVETVLKVAGVDVMATLSSEESRAIEAEESLETNIGLSDKGTQTVNDWNRYVSVMNGSNDMISDFSGNIIMSSSQAQQLYGPINLVNFGLFMLNIRETEAIEISQAADASIMATLSSEVSRAESAEASIAEELSSEVSYIMANTDLSSIDSFAEVVADLSSEVSRAESVEATKLDLAGGTMSGGINMAENVINNVSVLTANDFYTNGIASKAIGGEVYLQSPFNANNVSPIINLPAPINGGDAVNKTYVDSIYAKKVAVTETPDGSTTTFTLSNSVRVGSELVYLNGLSLDSEDYTANITNGLVTSVTFTTAPSTGDKVKAYGVY